MQNITVSRMSFDMWDFLMSAGSEKEEDHE